MNRRFSPIGWLAAALIFAAFIPTLVGVECLDSLRPGKNIGCTARVVFSRQAEFYVLAVCLAFVGGVATTGFLQWAADVVDWVRSHKVVAKLRAFPWTATAGWVGGLLCMQALEQFIPAATCNDGWASASIGSRGACSHHGGVNSQGHWRFLAFIASAGFGIFVTWGLRSLRDALFSSIRPSDQTLAPPTRPALEHAAATPRLPPNQFKGDVAQAPPPPSPKARRKAKKLAAASKRATPRSQKQPSRLVTEERSVPKAEKPLPQPDKAPSVVTSCHPYGSPQEHAKVLRRIGVGESQILALYPELATGKKVR